MRLILMGMGGPLSSAPLQHLLRAGFAFDAVVMAAPHKEIRWRELRPPQLRPQTARLDPHATRSIVQMAWDHGIALYETGNLRAAEVLDALQRLEPDAVLVSCFDQRVPQTLLGLPRHGFLNLHPSLLPAYRGPHPLFWQLRNGLSEIGLTVHRMDAGLDTGPIALQTTISLEDGMSGAQIEQRAGAQGGELFAQVLNALAAGELSYSRQEAAGSSQERPRDADFALDRRWPARRAFNFMCGTAEWGCPYPVAVGDRRWLLRRAVAFDSAASLPAPVVEHGDSLRIQFSPGVLEAV
jgi:methionyl-tRNA formyltransferase